MNIDREIAEKVMGYCERPVHGIGWWHQAEENRWSVAQYSWHPSTDIKQSFEVVEKMRERGWLLDKLTNICVRKHYWQASFWKAVVWENTYGNADTPAMAVCLAALKAMEDK